MRNFSLEKHVAVAVDELSLICAGKQEGAVKHVDRVSSVSLEHRLVSLKRVDSSNAVGVLGHIHVVRKLIINNIAVVVARKKEVELVVIEVPVVLTKVAVTYVISENVISLMRIEAVIINRH